MPGDRGSLGFDGRVLIEVKDANRPPSAGPEPARSARMTAIAIRHILVPVDFGDVADRAIDLALAVAAPFAAKVTLFHASWLPPSSPVSYAEGLSWPTDELERRARETLDRVCSRVRPRYANVDAVVVQGEPREAILENAARLGVDLIVMGTHGRRGLSRALLGSVAERVVRTATVPVLTVSTGAAPVGS
jgi:nucleotide-binding universal stress UspA family protein